ncbi:hypothetical protein BCT84_14240 [Vibrio breoganii]|nr:hypothetical protein BCT84_14240 [Vibrio breoganii]
MFFVLKIKKVNNTETTRAIKLALEYIINTQTIDNTVRQYFNIIIDFLLVPINKKYSVVKENSNAKEFGFTKFGLSPLIK